MRTRKLGLTLFGGWPLSSLPCSSGTSSPSAAAPESQAPVSPKPRLRQLRDPGSGIRPPHR